MLMNSSAFKDATSRTIALKVAGPPWTAPDRSRSRRFPLSTLSRLAPGSLVPPSTGSP